MYLESKIQRKKCKFCGLYNYVKRNSHNNT